jgi:hypothetical protein
MPVFWVSTNVEFFCLGGGRGGVGDVSIVLSSFCHVIAFSDEIFSFFFSIQNYWTNEENGVLNLQTICLVTSTSTRNWWMFIDYFDDKWYRNSRGVFFPILCQLMDTICVCVCVCVCIEKEKKNWFPLHVTDGDRRRSTAVWEIESRSDIERRALSLSLSLLLLNCPVNWAKHFFL